MRIKFKSELDDKFNVIIGRIQDLFINFLKLGFLKRFLITYIGCWAGFISMFLFSKLLAILFTKKTVGIVDTVASKKFEVVSHAVSSSVSHGTFSYLSIVLSYFISNSSACIIILLIFPIVAYIYKKEITSGKSSATEYLNSMILFYIIVVINPLTGMLGYNMSISDIIVVLPHGLFEFAGFALSINMGIILAEKIFPIVKNKRIYMNNVNDITNSNIEDIHNYSIKNDCSTYDDITVPNSDKIHPNSHTMYGYNNEYNNEHINIAKTKNIYILFGIFGIFILIGIAASLEPIDWIIYEYAKINNLNLAHTIIVAYTNIIYYLLNNIW